MYTQQIWSVDLESVNKTHKPSSLNGEALNRVLAEMLAVPQKTVRHPTPNILSLIFCQTDDGPDISEQFRYLQAGSGVYLKYKLTN